MQSEMEVCIEDTALIHSTSKKSILDLEEV